MFKPDLYYLKKKNLNKPLMHTKRGPVHKMRIYFLKASFCVILARLSHLVPINAVIARRLTLLLGNYWQWAYSEDDCQSVKWWLFHYFNSFLGQAAR